MIGKTQDGAQLSLSFEGVQFIAVADMPAVDEQLRQARPAAPRANIQAAPGITVKANLSVDDAVTIQQRASPRAIPAP